MSLRFIIYTFLAALAALGVGAMVLFWRPWG